ncbi:MULTISPECIES: DNA gyrase inhibitor YacG [Pseudoalteromonas]|uniref:DNA gyrase inhibitor YacG n=1 Tax=Pseudoalteromonas TaxID=53246 RepID=UPI0016026885|nr:MULTISPECIES: DNA gyrase inhibitor YacG [Pseudoalteromonas]MBB1293927.1 DNA gyrase inhibitor YacG [Pseudoalteromonas sp. SR41-4]MBB1335696.1 DNA gyrase inhibitor YacG [Pseudoalteromonas sp. SR41-6]MBB1399991.1 DNA gyrase inhibitor YacG [Pseudoalteromonas sp. SG44-8]MBB1461237.1 DNA gyrase inhibitor YacG [Pseudoalteromonas sp. SG41-8]MBB1505917.1 DNA gyrase inhibitor YacG [Pseudoalteromonas sp. SG41-1]|tara:strand:+ start:491 stop:721 length:231 start_codon:yes stop_codon:yes gene_type:complete
MPTVVSCPTCKNQVEWSEKSPHRPFCSKRCQLIDLGEWSFENNKISAPITSADDLSQDMIEDIEAMLAKNDDDFFK